MDAKDSTTWELGGPDARAHDNYVIWGSGSGCSGFRGYWLITTMSDILAQHPPAVKVGGRRLSISRSKHHPQHEQVQAEIPTVRDEEPVDYPRPNPPPELVAQNSEGAVVEEPHAQQHAHYEEEVPRNERKHQQQGYEIEKKLRTVKPDVNRPTRDNLPTGGGGRRIDQPAGKGFVV